MLERESLIRDATDSIASINIIIDIASFYDKSSAIQSDSYSKCTNIYEYSIHVMRTSIPSHGFTIACKRCAL